MALQVSERTPLDTLAKIRMPGGATPGYVMVAKTDIDFTNNCHTTLLLCYVNEQARRDDIQSAHPYFIGGPLSPEQIEDMKTHDVREVLYREIERLIVDHAAQSTSGRIG